MNNSAEFVLICIESLCVQAYEDTIGAKWCYINQVFSSSVEFLVESK